MKSAWVDSDAKAALDHWAKAGVSADLALRVYSTRLLGREPKLVLHGGGNTSVKTRIKDLLGEEAEVLCVKGSGWDMASIEPAGMPAVRLEPLRKLRARDAMPDEEMVRVQRAGLIDPQAPNPSVETLLHAFVPHKFVDHTHATAVLSLIDQAAERSAVRGNFRPSPRLRALRHAGLRAGKKSCRGVREKPQSRRADPRQARHFYVRQ